MESYDIWKYRLSQEVHKLRLAEKNQVVLIWKFLVFLLSRKFHLKKKNIHVGAIIFTEPFLNFLLLLLQVTMFPGTKKRKLYVWEMLTVKATYVFLVTHFQHEMDVLQNKVEKIVEPLFSVFITSFFLSFIFSR